MVMMTLILKGRGAGEHSEGVFVPPPRPKLISPVCTEAPIPSFNASLFLCGKPEILCVTLGLPLHNMADAVSPVTFGFTISRYD